MAWSMKFSEQELESQFRHRWAHDSAYMDKYFMVISFIGLTGWFCTCHRIDSALDLDAGSCVAVYIPHLGYTSWCLLRAAINAIACTVGVLRALTALSSWLYFQWHFDNRPVLTAVHIVVETVAIVLFAIMRCFLQWQAFPGATTRMLLCDVWLALLIIQLNPQLEWVVPLTAVHTAACMAVHALFAPAPGLHDYLIYLALKFVIPVGVMRMYESRARKLFIGSVKSAADTKQPAGQQPGNTAGDRSSLSPSKRASWCQGDVDGPGSSAAGGPVMLSANGTAQPVSDGTQAVQDEVLPGTSAGQLPLMHQPEVQAAPERSSIQQSSGAQAAADVQPQGQQGGPAKAAVDATRAAWLALTDAAQPEQPTDSSTTGSSQPFIPPPVAAVAPVHGPIHPRPSVPVNQGPSLVYESPLLHRTVAVKVLTEVEGGESLELSRLAATMQTAVAGLQGMYPTTFRRNICIPGCAMYLGGLTWEQQQRKPQQMPTQQYCCQQQQCVVPAYQAGAWQVQLGGSDSSSGPYQQRTAAGRELLVYKTMAELEDAVADGSLEAHMQELRQAAVWQEAYAVAAWGSPLSLVLQQQTSSPPSCCKCEDTSASSNGCGSCSNSGTLGNLEVRVVLSEGSTVVLDEQQQLQPVDKRGKAGWQLDLQLPRISNTSHCPHDLQVCVMSLHILPQEGDWPPVQYRTSHGSCSAGEGTFAHVTVLLLPAVAAAQLLEWVQQHRHSQQQLQPLMLDLAAALEACNVLQGSQCSSSSSVGSGQLQAPKDSWATAAEAAARAEQHFSRHSRMTEMVRLMGFCRVRLEIALQVAEGR